MSIGLLGQWEAGSHPSSPCTISSLADDAPSSSNKKPRSKRIHPITFNAWRFWWWRHQTGIAEASVPRDRGDKDKLEEAHFKQIQKSRPDPVQWTTKFVETLKNSSFSFCAFAVILSNSRNLRQSSPVGGVLLIGQWGIFGAAALASSAAVTKFILDSSVAAIKAQSHELRAPRTSIEQYEDFLISQLTVFKKGRKHARGL